MKNFSENMRLPFALLIGSLVVAGCAGRAPKLNRDWQPQELYARVLENYQRLQTFRGEGPLTVESPQIRLVAPAKILVQKPDSIFIKVEATLGIDAGFFFADRRRFATFSPLENLYFYGETAKVRELTLFQMDLTFDEMLSGMIGAALPSFDSTFTVTRDGDDYRFAGKRRQRLSDAVMSNGVTHYAAMAIDDAAEWRVTYWVNAERGVVVKAEQRDENGELYARQDFKRFRQVRGVWLPQHIQMQRPGVKERLTIFYNHIEINDKIAPAEFVIRVPKNVRRVDLSDPNGQGEMQNQFQENQ
jgi:outer membrane lipoprotein-sorting protein